MLSSSVGTNKKSVLVWVWEFSYFTLSITRRSTRGPEEVIYCRYYRFCSWHIENVAISSQGGRQVDIFNLDIFREIPLQPSLRLLSNTAMNPTLNVLSSFGYMSFFPSSSSSSSSPRQVSQTQPVIFNKCLKLSTGFCPGGSRND